MPTAVLLWAVLALTPSTPGQTVGLEYKVKAGLIYRFSKYVTWPDQAFENSGAPIVVGVLGEDPFGQVLDTVLQKGRSRNRPLIAVRFASADDIEVCHILFISRSERRDAAQILKTLGQRPILTISESPGFCRQGGLLNFFLKEGKVRFEINASRANECGLRISSQLLRRARIVSPRARG